MRILFVCTGNTCRSPMAAALLRRLAKQRGYSLEVRSAGLAAVPGLPASEHAREVLRRRGVEDVEEHRSRSVAQEDVEWADVVLTMTEGHKRMMHARFPSAVSKVFTLNEYAWPGENAKDIADPFGGDVEEYARCLEEIEKALTALMDRLTRETDGTQAEHRDGEAGGNTEDAGNGGPPRNAREDAEDTQGGPSDAPGGQFPPTPRAADNDC
ncbi:low molecular weight protein arginine phosphatase [Kyrpidia sp.]|uniref:low molecular weight protein arginine phosphatase n=1 Tax=Kyrpidia sp. TaxID=2073077 RepID=UPI00338DCDE4|nr:low molecular weight protein arginine phosphatase [Kyrpidia sp.]